MDDQFAIQQAREATKVRPVQPVGNSQLKPNEEENFANRTADIEKKEKAVQVDQASAIVDKMNDFLDSFSTKLQFKFDPESNATRILVMEKDTDRVIRQIPPEELVNLSDKMDEISGIIFNTEA